MNACTNWLQSLSRRGDWIEHTRFAPPTEVEARCLARKRHREAERELRA